MVPSHHDVLRTHAVIVRQMDSSGLDFTLWEKGKVARGLFCFLIVR